jgi:hypothetical protein
MWEVILYVGAHNHKMTAKMSQLVRTVIMATYCAGRGRN